MNTDAPQPLTAIIIDDEPLAREGLSGLLSSYVSEMEVVAEAGNVAEGIRQIRAHHPDVVFLDIEMPGEDGFQLFKYFNPIPFQTIFVTAYDGFALKAFRFSAMDYLLKPIEPQALQDAVEKVRIQIKGKQNRQDYGQVAELIQRNQLDRIAIPTQTGLDMVALEQILRVEGDGSYSTLVLQDGRKIVSSKAIGYFEELLSDLRFLRIHQTHLVNLQAVTRYHKGRGGQVTLTNGDTVDVSVRRKADLLRRLKG